MAHYKIRQVMTADVVTVTSDTRFKELACVMAKHNISAVPVVDGEGRVAGVVSEVDLLRKQEYQEDPAAARARDGGAGRTGPGPRGARHGMS